MSSKQLSVVGPRIKVRVLKLDEEISSGGIVIAKTITADEGMEENGERGVVVQLGHCAYGNFSENWCNVGDEVFFQRFAGKPFEEMDKDGKIGYYRIIKDIDVIAVIEATTTKSGEKICQIEKS